LTKPRSPHRSRPAQRRKKAGAATATDEVIVRAVRRADVDQVIAIDATVTGLEKRSYWLRVYRRYGTVGGREPRHFLVAVSGDHVLGFLIGEVRDWEFGSPPCGWVFAIDTHPQARQSGIASRLLEALSAKFRRAGVSKLRTLLARDNTLVLSFFRSQGMMAAPLIPLEMDLLPPGPRAATDAAP